MRWEDEKMMDKLKPCPFYGGEGVMDRVTDSFCSFYYVRRRK
jgi:hypothetical protein